MIRRPPRSTLLSLHDPLPIFSTSVCWRLTRAARYPLDPPAIANFLRLAYWLISKVRVSSLDRARDSIDLVAADRKSTRLNSSHQIISYAVFCLKKKKTTTSYKQQPFGLREYFVRVTPVTQTASSSDCDLSTTTLCRSLWTAPLFSHGLLRPPCH